MATKYTGDNYTPHFGGLWAPADDAKRFGDRRLALLFLGECYLVFFEYFPKSDSLSYSSQTYLLEEDQIFMSPMTPSENPEAEEMQVLYWGLTKDGLLEIEEDGKASIWEPVEVKTLAGEGFPVAAIEGYRKAYSQNGIKYSVVGYAPSRATMEAVKNFKQQREK